jgi:hypothetical protein
MSGMTHPIGLAAPTVLELAPPTRPSSARLMLAKTRQRLASLRQADPRRTKADA